MIDQEKLKKLNEALQKRGFYNPYDVFCHEPTITQAKDPKYEFKIEVMKWNTSSAQVVILGARWSKKEHRYILSTYKTGSIKRQKHETGSMR